MGDMADFYGWYDCGDECATPDIDNLLVCDDEKIYNACKKIKISQEYEYKDLCEKILDYYTAKHKLSIRQKVALCCLLYNQGCYEEEDLDC